MTRKPLRLLGALPVLLAGSLLAACSGSGTPGPVVAQGTTAATPSSAASASAGGSPAEKALAFSQCMRSHGVPKFPDPQTAGGGMRLTIGKGSGIDPQSPQFQSAQRACQSLMPAGKGGSGGSVDPTKITAWAACMRRSGLPDFPDPQNNGQGLALDLSGTGIDPASPAFDKARKACQSDYPGGGLMITNSHPGGGK
jgi:hypothetical protein